MALAPLAAVLALAAPAAAAPLPPDDYEVVFANTTLSVGFLRYTAPGGTAGVFTVPTGATGELTLPTIQPAFGTAVFNLNLPGYPRVSLQSTITLVQPVLGTIDPATGHATLTTAGHSRVWGSAPDLPVADFDCTVGSPAAPVPMALSTATGGSAWNPDTAVARFAGSTPLPPADCIEDADESTVNAVMGGQGALRGQVRATIWPPGQPLPTPPVNPPDDDDDDGPGGGGPGGAPQTGPLRVASARLLVGSRGAGILKLRCVRVSSPCVGRVRVDTVRGGAAAAFRVAGTRFSIPADSVGKVRLRLRKRARRALERRGRLRAQLRITMEGLDSPWSGSSSFGRVSATRPRSTLAGVTPRPAK